MSRFTSKHGAANHCAFAFGRANLDSGVDGAVTAVGYAPEEIATHESTRSARLKWVVVVDNAVPVGRMVKAVAWPPRARVRRSPICSDPVGLTRPGDSTSVCRGRGAPCWPPIPAVSPRFENGQMASDGVRVADMPRSRRPTGLRRVRGRTCRDETRGSGRLCRQHRRARTKVGKLVTRLDLLIRPLPWPSPRRVLPPGQFGDHREVQCVGLGEVDPLGRMAIAQVQQAARSFVGDCFGGRGQRAHVQ